MARVNCYRADRMGEGAKSSSEILQPTGEVPCGRHPSDALVVTHDGQAVALILPVALPRPIDQWWRKKQTSTDRVEVRALGSAR
jgi:hypothetical protein